MRIEPGIVFLTTPMLAMVMKFRMPTTTTTMMMDNDDDDDDDDDDG